ESAAVNFAMETARVSYAPGAVTMEDMQARVEKLGYGAMPVQEAKDAEERRADELRKQRLKLIFSAILSAPLLWAMAGHFSFTSWIYVPSVFMNPWFQLVLATPVQFIVGASFYEGAYKALRNGSANMDVLVALGTSAAYFYSLFLSLQWYAEGAMMGHAPALYFETSAVLIDRKSTRLNSSHVKISY